MQSNVISSLAKLLMFTAPEMRTLAAAFLKAPVPLRTLFSPGRGIAPVMWVTVGEPAVTG
jgi:hypothetical protein